MSRGDCGTRLQNIRLLYVIFEVLEAQTRIRALKVLVGTQSNERFIVFIRVGTCEELNI